MAYAELTVQSVVRAGLDPTMVAVDTTDGDYFSNNGKTFLYIVKGTGGTTVTIQTPDTVDGLAVAERTVSIATGTDYMIGPFPPSVYNRSDDTVRVTYSTDDSTTIAALSL